MLPSFSTFLVGLLIFWGSEVLLLAMHASRLQPFGLTQITELATDPSDFHSAFTRSLLGAGLAILEQFTIEHTILLRLRVL